MRLICPNCDAEYEVPDSAIPQEGRDVQCSNCGHTWFFDPSQPEEPEPIVDDGPEPEPEPATDPEPEEIAPEPAPELEQPDPEPAAVAPRRPVQRPKRTPAPTFTPPSEAPPAYPADDREPDAVAKAAADAPAAKPAPKRRELQPEVAEVLRQEAEFEASARARDAGLEVQGDLGLETPPVPPLPIADDIAKGGEKAARRDLLPDIDEINSTLRAAGDRDAPIAAEVDAEAVAQDRRKGFRIGFGLSLLILGALAALYSYAPQVAEALPGLSAALDQYTGGVDALRVWLAEQVERGVATVQGLSSSS